MAGCSFDLHVPGRSSSAVLVDLPEIHAWALRQEDPDKTVAGRVWTSEAILWRTPDRPPRFAARLIVASAEADLDIEPAVPGYLRQLVDKIGLTSGGHPLSSQPRYIGKAEEESNLLDFLADPGRRLPVIVVAVNDRANPQIPFDLDRLASGLCGIAEVAAILPTTSWALTDRFNKRLSVFDRGIRVYMPGFDDDADPYGHPLWLGARLAAQHEADLVEREIRKHVARFSTRSVRMGADILPFAQLRSFSREAEQHRLSGRGASDREKLSAADARIEALTKELKEAKELEQYALEEESKAQIRVEEAESRARSAIARIQSLETRLSAGSAAEGRMPDLPKKWEEFIDWCDRELVGRIVLHKAARRSIRKACFLDVEQAARCVRWLANECRDRFLQGGGTLSEEPVEQGIRNSACGGDEFRFEWQSQRLSAEWHVKSGGNTRAPEHCLRIYYAWDDQTQQIVIADMPGHRRTGAS